MILPEIGGRIFAGLDKTNRYDFFYRQNVIKPALVGCLDPGSQAALSSTGRSIIAHPPICRFMRLLRETPRRRHGVAQRARSHAADERHGGHLSFAGQSPRRGRVRLFNRTPLPQTFLWWANVAVRVHDQYQAFFPPDVTFVADHAKRAISSFLSLAISITAWITVQAPISPGTRTFRSQPPIWLPSRTIDFCGGYDHARQAGVVQTSNHHVAPGKKMWTWGNAEFGYAWDRNLTDEDGPYMELMAGAYTDNQPDFSWLQPYETKTFSQFWYPIQKTGPAKNANTQAAVNLDFGRGAVFARRLRYLAPECTDCAHAEWKINP